jgi:hypothetical protein
MRHARNCVRWSLCAVIALGTITTNASAQPPSGTPQSKGPTPSLWVQAMGQYNLKNYTRAFALFLESAKQGDARGQDWVGYMYQMGVGVTQDYAQALYWFRKAADQGNADAQYSYGYMHQYGQGVGAIPSEARFFYQKAAAQGNQNAIQALAQMNSATQPAPAPQQAAAQQGTCAAVYDALAEGNDTAYYYGASWSNATLSDAQAGARAELVRHMNGAAIDTNYNPGGPEPGIYVVASGCGYSHGAVTGALMDDGTYNFYYAALSASTDDAINNATASCRSRLGPGTTYRGPCPVVVSW